MTKHHYLALDLGAESGRVMLGTLDDKGLQLEEIYRFPNGAISIGETLRWDIMRLFEEIKTGLQIAQSKGIVPVSLSADAWGVDYVYSRAGEPLLSLPYNYRDKRTQGGIEQACQRVPAETIFAETGIQFLAINTLYQFLADQAHQTELMQSADHFLNIGDFINFLLSGVARSEQSIASTTQLYNPQERAWSKKLVESFQFPEKIFPPIVPSGTVLGPLQPELAQKYSWPKTKVIATCSHDTGAAVAAIPAEGNDWAFLSSGTWSLLGIEKSQPIISEKSRAYNFTNEAGYGGTTRLLKNIVGLWIIQECRRDWLQQGRNFHYEELGLLALAATPWGTLIQPEDSRFSEPGNMLQKILDYAQETEQRLPQTPGEIIRCVYESLALLYRQTLLQLDELGGQKIQRLHIVGGGSKSELFNQLVANATQVTVIAGPVEATAIGNLLIQALVNGHLDSWEKMRATVRQSFPLKIYQPEGSLSWESACQKFLTLKK